MTAGALVTRKPRPARIALEGLLSLPRPRFSLKRRKPAPPPAEPLRELSFTFALIGLSARLSRSGPALSKDMFLAFREVFPLEDEASALVRSLFSLAWNEQAEAGWYARYIRDLYPDNPTLRRQVLERMARITLSNGPATRPSLMLLTEIADIFTIRRSTLSRILADCEAGKPLDPFRVLGLPRGAKARDVQAQYRELMRTYHPDRARHAFSYPEAQAVAEKKAREVGEAYGRLVR